MALRDPADYALIRPNTNKPKTRLVFDDAICDLRDGLAAGQIRNATLTDAKRRLGSIVEQAWSKHIREPYFHAGAWRNLPAEIVELEDSMNISSLHGLLAAKRKMDAAALPDHPAVTIMKSLMAEAHPIAEAVRDLQPMVVKGRAPTAPTPPANPDKVVASCSCCFRGIAVTGAGRMAHHGYQRPGDGYQTSSCEGVRFPPLEVSVEGLEWLVDTTKDKIAKDREIAAKAPEVTVLRWLEDRGRRNAPIQRECRPGEPEWPARHASYIRKCDAAVAQGEGFLEIINEELKKWRLHHGIDEPDAEASGPSI